MSLPCQHEPCALVTYDEVQVQRAAAMCHALSDPERLKLMLLLREKRLCVSELVAQSGAKVSSVSMRLQTLVHAGLLGRQREAKHVYYRLSDQHVHNLLSNILEHAMELPSSSTTE